MVRHKNDYGYWEEVDRLPVPGCGCTKCSRAADRDAERESRRSQRPRGWQSGGSVDGRPARTKEQGGRIDAIWDGGRGNRPGDGHGHIVSNDGVNADYVRDPGMDHDDYVVDNREDVVDPYDSSRGRRRRRR